MELLTKIAHLLADIQVPRSLGSLGHGSKMYDAVRKEIGVVGWMTPEEIETHLRRRLIDRRRPIPNEER